MKKTSKQTPWYQNNKVIVSGAVGIALIAFVFSSGAASPAPLNINEVSQAFVSQPTTLVNSWTFESNKVVANSGWKLFGYKGLIPYAENGVMVIPGPITDSVGLWTNKLNIPVANFDKQGLLVEVTLASTSKSSSTPVSFKMVAGLSEDTTLNGVAFAGAQTDAMVSSELTTYSFLFTPNQFVNAKNIKSITIGLNPTGADVGSLIVKSVMIKTID